MEALSHRRGEVVDMGPVPGHAGRTRLSMICPSRLATLDLLVNYVCAANLHFLHLVFHVSITSVTRLYDYGGLKFI